MYVYEKQLVKIGTGDITDIKDKTSQILLLSYTTSRHRDTEIDFIDILDE